MKTCLTLVFALVACVATAAEQTRPTISDVSLQDNGVLRGQILDTTGLPQAKSQVALVKDGKLVATTMTDAQGQFAVASITPGVYQIESAHAGGVYRVWNAQTAPPVAKSGILMVGDTSVVRGELFHHNGVYGPALRGAVAGGLLGAGLVAILDHNPSGS